MEEIGENKEKQPSYLVMTSPEAGELTLPAPCHVARLSRSVGKEWAVLVAE